MESYRAIRGPAHPPLAANRGAEEVGATSIGCNIQIPCKQRLNQYVDIGVRFRQLLPR